MESIKVVKNVTILNEKACSEADLNINVEGIMKRGGSDII